MVSTTVFLGLGSNLGRREEHLSKGLALLARSLEVVATSSVYETEPWGFTGQPSFLNMVCQVRTGMTAEELLLFCQGIERQVGRTPTFRYGPRVLDIDILDYGGLVTSTPRLVVPHPGLQERAFVLVPLAEIAPGWVHPLSRKTAAQLVAELPSHQGVQMWGGLLAVPPSG